MSISAKWLTDSAWEKRIRRALNKHGWVLHKSRRRDGGYLVASPGEETRWFSSLDKLQDFAEQYAG